eukprot:6654497-Lingulodinium_polyedra.AAC.1
MPASCSMGSRWANVKSEYSLAKFLITLSPAPSLPFPPSRCRLPDSVACSSDMLTWRPRPL